MGPASKAELPGSWGALTPVDAVGTQWEAREVGEVSDKTGT